MPNQTMLDAYAFPGKHGGERIQAAIDSLSDQPKVIHVGSRGPDAGGRWLLTKAIMLPSNTTLILDSARLFLADNASDNLIRNLHSSSATCTPTVVMTGAMRTVTSSG